MGRYRWLFLGCLWAWASCAPGLAQALRAEHLSVQLVAESRSIQPGRPFWVGLHLAPDPHWKTYWRNPGDSGLATELNWRLPEGWRAGELLWPYPRRFQVQGVVSYGYPGETVLLTQITPAVDLSPETAMTLTAMASWLVCNDVCIPGGAELSLTLPVLDRPPDPSPWTEVMDRARADLPRQARDWTVGFDVRDGHFLMAVQASDEAFAPVREAEFFPFSREAVAQGGSQQWRLSPRRLDLSQVLLKKIAAPPERIEGVLVLRGVDRTAYRIEALPSAQVGLKLAGPRLAGPRLAGPRLAGPRASDGAGLAYILVLALGGGVLLNLMPCVFPVLSLKAVGLLESIHVSHHAQRMHGIAYTLGVLVFFCAVAAVLILLKAGGASVGWGFQLQIPWFVALLAYLLFLLSLSFAGLLEFGGRFMGVGESLTHRGGYLGSFFTGALAAVVASPCTAPFMGTAIAYAVTQSPTHAMAVFLALGLGMALPFLVVAFVPALARVLPRPGPWMNVFKQVLAFPLYLTVIWLLWVLGRQTDVSGMAVALLGMVLLLFAVWLRHVKPPPQGKWKTVNIGLATLAAVTAFVLLAAPSLDSRVTHGNGGKEFWQRYSPERLAELRAEGRPVFLNVTADWCISCIANERVALSFPAVRQAFRDNGVVPLKADWTNRDPEVSRVLEAFGRGGVPLYVLYPPGVEGEPEMLPQWLTPITVTGALEAQFGKRYRGRHHSPPEDTAVIW